MSPDASPLLDGIHHIALIVAELAAARRFYLDVLGGEEIAAHYRAERDSWKVDIRLPGGVQLEVFTFPQAPSRPSRPEARGLRHLAFQVANLDAVLARLASYAVICEPIRIDDYTGARFTFCADPDGLPIEFYEVAQAGQTRPGQQTATDPSPVMHCNIQPAIIGSYSHP